MNNLTVEAVAESITRIIEFINGQLEANKCPADIQAQIDIAADEIFGNIVNYAYGSETGSVSVRVETETDLPSVTITFTDSGLPFDPLSASDPDIARPACEREIGGLGIFLVKSIMDSVSYQYSDGQNILRIRKKFR